MADEIPPEAQAELLREGLVEVVVGADGELIYRISEKGRHVHQKMMELDSNFDELVDKGYIEPAGVGPAGNTLYRLTSREPQVDQPERTSDDAVRGALSVATTRSTAPSVVHSSSKVVRAQIKSALFTGRPVPIFVVNPGRLLDDRGDFLEEDSFEEQVFGRIIEIGCRLPEGKRAAGSWVCWRKKRDRLTGLWKECGGVLKITRDDVGRTPGDPQPGIWWVCSTCWFIGVVEAWEGTPWDLRETA
jgi:hypothetical protein